ncbi:pyridoxamine 5'-phosphate oxidase family protein [Ilumatobacter nonamiensis]|uniref:pyridoxamine 5'-phosphate oxidase family protein n=1 Tax=Ilumatobacter nonamiensis TaxID=467093 RepID=UPI00034B7366|nr:pyridoxamine 5'-phosphate oxidase family protein [Ilumatobacter nonamiensis]
MRLTADEAIARLQAHDHGVLCTVHAERGIDAVPAVYTADDRTVSIPVDRIKAKSSIHLQRVRNLEADPRATLLIEHWNRDDWSQLWWVRAHLRWNGPASNDSTDAAAARLAEHFPQYRNRPFAAILELHITTTTGWSADD